MHCPTPRRPLRHSALQRVPIHVEPGPCSRPQRRGFWSWSHCAQNGLFEALCHPLCSYTALIRILDNTQTGRDRFASECQRSNEEGCWARGKSVVKTHECLMVPRCLSSWCLSVCRHGMPGVCRHGMPGVCCHGTQVSVVMVPKFLSSWYKGVNGWTKRRRL